MRTIPVGHALSLFLAVTFTACIIWGLFAPPAMHMHKAWESLLPGFQWISVSAFFIGLAWAYAYGWYTALVFVPISNFFNKRGAAE